MPQRRSVCKKKVENSTYSTDQNEKVDQATSNRNTITSFEGCVKAGYSLKQHIFPQATAYIPDEKYYRDCVTPDGRVYTGKIPH